MVKQLQKTECLSLHSLFTLNGISKRKCHSWRRLGIYVCASDKDRKRLAPSGDTQAQRSIDGVNSEFVFRTFFLHLSLPISVLSLSLSL